MGANEPDQEQGGGTETSGIKVTDRRLFTSEGKLRGQMADMDAEAEAIRAPLSPTPSGAAESGSADRGFARRPLDEPGEIDFTMLINAMAQPALIFLGEIPHPSSGRAEINLEQARLQIDLLDILRIKCRGNLTVEEQTLLDRILYQLRMLYVSRSSQPGG